MANSAQSKKRARQGERRRQHNMSLRSAYRTLVKRVRYAIEEGDADKAKSAYALASPMIDKVASKGIIHRNKAARSKSRLNAAVKLMQA